MGGITPLWTALQVVVITKRKKKIKEDALKGNQRYANRRHCQWIPARGAPAGQSSGALQHPAGKVYTPVSQRAAANRPLTVDGGNPLLQGCFPSELKP